MNEQLLERDNRVSQRRECAPVSPATERAEHWPYVSLRLDVRELPNSKPWNEPTMWLSAAQPGCAERGPAELYYRLSAVVYGRLTVAVERLLQPSKRKDEISGRMVESLPDEKAQASAAAAMVLLAPLYDFLAARYAALALSEGASAEEGWQALADDIADARSGRTMLPPPHATEMEIRRLERLAAADRREGLRNWVESWGRDTHAVSQLEPAAP